MTTCGKRALPHHGPRCPIRIAEFVAGPRSIERIDGQFEEHQGLAKWKLLDAVTWKLFSAD